MLNPEMLVGKLLGSMLSGGLGKKSKSLLKPGGDLLNTKNVLIGLGVAGAADVVSALGETP